MQNAAGSIRFTGAEIRRIMRTHGITIRQAARVFNISMATVRIRRASGVEGELRCWEWSVYLPHQVRLASWSQA